MTNKIGEYAVGISFLYSLYDTLKSRASFTRLLPTLITSQVYPWTVLSVDEKNAGSDLLRELNATKDNIKDAKINREVPLITMPNYFKLEQFTQTNKNMSQLLSTITEFTDKNIFAVFGLNDSILYAKGSTDLSRKQGRDLFLSSLKARQREMEIVIDELIDEYMLNKSSLNTDYDFLFSEISKEDADASLSRILSAYKSNLINEEQAKGMYKQAETLEIPSEKKKENIELSGGVDDT